MLEESLDVERRVELTDFGVDVEECGEDLGDVEVMTELVDVFGGVEDGDTDPLLLLDTVPCEAVPFRMYTLSLLPAPQYSYWSPAQVIEQSLSGAITEPEPKVSAHQHSRPYSAPAYRYGEHAATHASIVLVSDGWDAAPRARTPLPSVKQPI